MMERTKYFISIENKMIETTKMPGQAELEISATEDELKIIQNYMDNKKKVSEEKKEAKYSPKDTPSASYTPSIGSEENYDSDFEKLIDLIYKLGTEETKESLEQYR